MLATLHSAKREDVIKHLASYPGHEPKDLFGIESLCYHSSRDVIRKKEFFIMWSGLRLFTCSTVTADISLKESVCEASVKENSFVPVMVTSFLDS